MPPVFLSPNTTVIDCGASRTTLGEFQLSGRRLRCVHFAAESFSSEPVGEDSWLEHTAAALHSLNVRRRWNGPVVLVLPAHLTLTKHIKVPRVELARRTQIIRFEAEQTIPHGLTHMVWGSVVSGQRDAEEEILLVAAKREIVDRLCAAMTTAGFEPARILPSSLATLALFRLVQPELAQPALVLNLSEHSTTLLQIEGRRFAVRTLFLGGPNGTQQPWENKAIESDEEKQSLVARLVQEISRTVQHFARDGGLANPVGLFLAGGAERLAGLDAELASRLKIPVENIDWLNAVEFSPDFVTTNSALLAPVDLFGAAAIDLLPLQPTIDLLPPALRQRVSLRRRQPWMTAAALLIVVALVPPVMHFRQIAAAARAKVAALEKVLVPMRARQTHTRSDLAKLQQLKVQIALLHAVHDRRTAWLQLFADLQEQLTRGEDVWLEKFLTVPAVEGRPMKLAISGRMLDRPSSLVRGSAETFNRVRKLMAGIGDLPWVTAVEGERFDHSQPGLLRFEFILVTNSARPL